jgi:hypothetical protein
MGMIRKPWSLLSPREIDKLRDVLRDELQQIHPRRFAIGEFQAITAVFEELAACIPQVHATWGTVLRCCPDGSWQWKLNKVGLVKQACLAGLHATIDQESRMQGVADAQHAIQLLLDPNPDMSPVTAQYVGRCQGGSCAQSGPQYQKVVLDRPPPTLVLKSFEMTARIGFLQGWFDHLILHLVVFSHAGLRKVQTRYVFGGCIIFKGGNHFAVCINLEARRGGWEVVLYDGMRHNGAAAPIRGSLEQFLKQRKYGISMPFYCRQS